MNFKFKNIVLVSLLAVAGILGVSSVLVDKGSNDNHVAEKADASVTNGKYRINVLTNSANWLQDSVNTVFNPAGSNVAMTRDTDFTKSGTNGNYASVTIGSTTYNWQTYEMSAKTGITKNENYWFGRGTASSNYNWFNSNINLYTNFRNNNWDNTIIISGSWDNFSATAYGWYVKVCLHTGLNLGTTSYILMNSGSTPDDPGAISGYTFAGWYTDNALSTAWTSGSQYTDINLYAKYTPNKYAATITAGTGISSVYLSSTNTATSGSVSGTKFDMGSTVYGFGVLQANYHKMDGWVLVSGTDNTAGAKYRVASKTITTSGAAFGTISALPNQYSITYKDEGGSSYSGDNIDDLPDTHTYGTSTALVDGEKDGWNFAGWYSDSDCTVEVTSLGATSYTSAITLYAKWTKDTYTIKYNLNGGSGVTPADQTPAVGATVTFATYSGTKTGYTFSGWNTNSTGTGTTYAAGGTGTPSVAKDATLNLFAKWTINSHTLTWNFNGGTASGFSPASGSSVNYGATITYPTSITKTGYNFAGYSTSVTTMPDNDLTITASWTAKTTTVTLDRQSGTGGSSSVTATYGLAMPSITVPTRDGFTFGGYYTATGGSGIQYYTSTGASARNWNFEDSTKTLYAKWTAKSYTITFNQNDGTGTSYTDTKTGGTAYTIPTPEQLGHTASGGRHFLRWATNSDGTGTSYAAGASYTTNAALNLFLIQDWYTYQYRINGGTWHTLTYKNPSDPTNYVREYYPEESIDLVTGDKITFQRYYGSGDPEAIGGTITWEGNYDGTDGVTYGVTGQFYLKVRNNGDYNCWVPGQSTTFGVIITRGGKDLYFPTTYNDGQYISGYISIQSGDVVKGKYTTGDAYALTLNEYSQGHWNSTGPTATAAGVYKFYLQSLDSINYNIVYISMNDQASAIFFAQNFNSTIGGICKMDGSTNKSSLTTAWGLTDASGLYKNYSFLTDEAKDYLVDTSENEDIIAFFQKYDYVLSKYGTGVVGNFLSRSVTPKASFNNYTINSLFGEDNFATVIIIISSSVALLSVTALSILVIRKRKSKEQ